jgi:hypothetical protein
MCLRNPVFVSRIVRRTIYRPEISLSGHASLQLVLDFRAAAFLERIGAADGKECSSQRQKDRTALHLPIL